MKNNGFTLLELSIVIVIIGLIVAGISAGQSLVRQAQLRSVLSEVNDFQSMVNSFQLAYDALPGDMTNASSYWPSCTGTPANCNGNGDGNIEYFPSWPYTEYEPTYAWHILSLAGFMNASLSPTNTVNMQIDTNIIGSSFAGGGWYMRKNDWFRDNIDSAIGEYNRFNIGATRSGEVSNTSLFTPSESQNIDTKADDGSPYAGSVMSIGGWTGSAHSTNCTSGSGTTATYALTNTSVECFMLFTFFAKR